MIAILPLFEITKTSICDCGHPALADTVKVGDRFYWIGKGDGTFTCHGCGAVTKVVCILAAPETGDGLGYIPADCFEQPTQTITE